MNAIDCLPDRYVVGRLGGCTPLPVFVLDTLPLYAATAVLQQIGRAALYGREYRKFGTDEFISLEIRTAGLKILRSWPRAFYDLLDQMMAQREASKEGTRAGMTGIYGDLYRWLYTNPNIELDVFRNALKRHAERRFVAHDAASAFGRQLETYAVSLGTVLDHYASPMVKTYLFAMHLGYVNASQPILRSHPIPTIGLEKIGAMLQDETDTRGAASYLGTDRHMLRDLCNRRMIEVISLRAQGRSLDVLLKANLDKFLGQLAGNAPDIAAPPEGTLTLVEAAKRADITYIDLIQAIFDSRIQVIGRLQGVNGLRSLLVDIADVRRFVTGSPDIYPLRQAAYMFGQSYNDLRALTMEGLIPTIAHPDPSNSSRLVTVSDCKKFFQDHASGSELAKYIKQPVSAVSRVLKLQNIDPVSRGGLYTLFYPRRSAETALISWDWTIDLPTRSLNARKSNKNHTESPRLKFKEVNIPECLHLLSRDVASELLKSFFGRMDGEATNSPVMSERIGTILKAEDGIDRAGREILVNGKFISPETTVQYLYLIHASGGEMSVRQMQSQLGGCRKAAGALHSYILKGAGLEMARNFLTSILDGGAQPA
jgi:hypothetical protein